MLYLLSSSIERKNILNENNISFSVYEKIIDAEKEQESILTGDPWSITRNLCENKFNNYDKMGFEIGSYCLCCDTICALKTDDEDTKSQYLILNKAESEKELKVFFALYAQHPMVTVVSWANLYRIEENDIKKFTFSDSAFIFLDNFNSEQLDTYCKSLAWQNRAGGINYTYLKNFSVKIQGDENTIRGIPCLENIIKTIS